jgi:hypothetical protein
MEQIFIVPAFVAATYEGWFRMAELDLKTSELIYGNESFTDQHYFPNKKETGLKLKVEDSFFWNDI